MKETNIFRFYAFGFDYGLLKNYGLLNFKKAEADAIFQGFFDAIDSLDLQVTKKACVSLKSLCKRLENSDYKEVSSEQSKEIKREVDKIDIVLDSELKLKKAYQLTDKRYALDKLLYSQSVLLANDVYNKLSDHTKKDFDLACVQIALNQPTAAAFHLMRALEDQIKLLYYHFKRTKRLSNPMWGPMIRELRTKKNPKPSEKLLDFLDSVRVHYRNPTQHPDLFYSIDEAQDLLNQTISALNMIIAEIQ